jgi:radical SAM protein with 4Fe4S-binding SPASM domain
VMFDITQLNASLPTPALANASKFASHQESHSPVDSLVAPAAVDAKPVVTWRVTRFCNLDCINCTSERHPHHSGAELSTSEGMEMIRDLAAFQIPELHFGGGEPLLRADLFELVAYAREWGIEPSLLTNGTLVTLANAEKLRGAGLHRVSILLEGIGREVDRHRGMPGTFNAVLEAYANCEAAGLAAEIRTPLNRSSYSELADILDLVERQGIRKVVFAHRVYVGPANRLHNDLTDAETRHVLDLLMERAEDFARRGVAIRIATDENHVDGIYRYLRFARKNPTGAQAACRLLQECKGGAEGAGVGLAGIDSVGNVHPDSYWTNHTLGNVRETPFSEIWGNSSDPLLLGLRDRLPLLKGKCANCRWKQTCGGNLRVRAEEYFGDPWMADPACYLTNEEIDKEVADLVEAMEDDVLLPEQAA